MARFSNSNITLSWRKERVHICIYTYMYSYMYTVQLASMHHMRISAFRALQFLFFLYTEPGKTLWWLQVDSTVDNPCRFLKQSLAKSFCFIGFFDVPINIWLRSNCLNVEESCNNSPCVMWNWSLLNKNLWN